MFRITIITSNHKQWSPEYVFTSYSDATNYLIKQGYVNQKGWFNKSVAAWGGATKALITPVQVYNPELSHTYKH